MIDPKYVTRNAPKKYKLREVSKKIAEQVNKRLHNGESWQAFSVERLERMAPRSFVWTKDRVAYILSKEVPRRLREVHNLCVIPVSRGFFILREPLEEIVSWPVEDLKPFVTTIAEGLYVALGQDGNLFVAWRQTNRNKQIVSRIKADAGLIGNEILNDRLTNEAKEAAISQFRSIGSTVGVIDKRLFNKPSAVLSEKAA